jgi:solute carrier family 25 carnitine/acylcarnitine transporter 20/29
MDDFISGLLGGWTSLVVGHPFDTVKVKMQTSLTPITPSKTIQSLWSESRRKPIWQNGFYKGITSPMLGVGAMNAIIFSGHAVCLDLVTKWFPRVPNYTQIAIAGAGTGIIQCLVAVPIDFCKIMAQTSSTPLSTFHFFKSHLKRPLSLYRGYLVTVLRDIPGYAAYFTSYEYTLDLLTNNIRGTNPNAEMPSTNLLIAGGVAGVVGWAISFPLDLIKSRIQSTPQGSRGEIMRIAKDIYKRDGFIGFFRGLSPTLLRAVPVNAVTFYTVERTRKWLQSWRG